MHVSYSESIKDKDIGTSLDSLADYRSFVKSVVDNSDFTKSESAIATYKDDLMRTGIAYVKERLGEVDQMILVGIGGSSLGTEVFRPFLPEGKQIHVLDSVSAHQVDKVITSVRGIDRSKMAVCVISKSGGTTETLANAEVLLKKLAEEFSGPVYDRVVFIGDPNNPLLLKGEELGTLTLPMHRSVGGRYSVFTAVGLVPLNLLGINVEETLKGLGAASSDENESVAAAGAATLFHYLKKGVTSVNFFVFDDRLNKLGYWYRQLAAESLGKEKTDAGKRNKLGFIPTVSTPIDLHSIGQLYFSGFPGVFTDFVNFETVDHSYDLGNETIVADKLTGKSMSDLEQAISAGVIKAYQESKLPYRLTELGDNKLYELGLFMGVRMLETMYLAKVMSVNAFDQPNVELYKVKTREILGI